MTKGPLIGINELRKILINNIEIRYIYTWFKDQMINIFLIENKIWNIYFLNKYK